MTNHFRVSLGERGKYAPQAVSEGWVGTGWLTTTDLTGKFPENWKDFNKEIIPVLLETGESTNRIGAGLAAGMTWTVAKGLQQGDIVLSSNGTGHFHVGKIDSEYYFTPGELLPHRRRVAWYPEMVARADMSEELSRNIGGYGTVQRLNYGTEIDQLIHGHVKEVFVSDENIESPVSFVLEKHLEDFLVSNWENTELGKLYNIYSENGEKVGRQYPTDTGQIDILAESKDGKELLVVELKRGRVSDVVVGQILRYMSYVKELDETKTVRGVIIGTDDDQRFRRALSMTNNIDFYKYEVNFKLFQ
jgi:restriction system protein